MAEVVIYLTGDRKPPYIYLYSCMNNTIIDHLALKLPQDIQGRKRTKSSSHMHSYLRTAKTWSNPETAALHAY